MKARNTQSSSGVVPSQWRDSSSTPAFFEFCVGVVLTAGSEKIVSVKKSEKMVHGDMSLSSGSAWEACML